MKDMKLKSTYIVPFSFGSISFDNLHEHNSAWNIEEENTIESDVYEYVRNSFITTGNVDDAHAIKIGCLYSYAGDLLPDNFKLKYINCDYEQLFYIREVKLALFQTGVGLLWFLPELKGGFKSSDHAIDFTYHMKEMARNERSNYLYKESIELIDGSEGDIQTDKLLPDGKRYKKDNPFYLGVWLDDIIKTISSSITYYPSRTRTIDGQKRSLPDKIVLFHCGVLEDCEGVDDTLVYLSRGYKESYRLPSEITQQIYKPFDNVRFFASAEGCGYYGLSGDDTPAFFSDLTKVNNDYFFLYMLALYQSYTLLHYSELISLKLSATKKDYDDYSKELEASLDSLTTELNIFLAKSVYSSVSHIQHQNEFFNYVTEKLLVRENIASVSAGIDALNNIERTLYEEEVEKKNQYLNVCLTIVSFLALFSAFNDINEFLINHIYRLLPFTDPALTYVLNAGLSLVTIFMIGKLIQYFIHDPDRKKSRRGKKKKS